MALGEEVETLRARLQVEQKPESAQRQRACQRLEKARYCIPQKYSEPVQHLESDESEAEEGEYNFEGDYEAERGVHPKSKWTQHHLATLLKHDEETQKSKSKKSKQKWNLHKRQGAKPSTHQAPVSGGSRSRDQIEPTGETPKQPNSRSRSEEK